MADFPSAHPAPSPDATAPGLSVAIPKGMAFQFRAAWDAPLVFVAVTMPPWPGEQEAETVEGMWAV